MELFGIFIVVFAIAFFEVPSMWKQKRIKDLATFSIILLFGTVLSIGESRGVDFPNPLDWITFLMKPVSEIFYQPLR